jgi:hypothetical protein
MIGPHRILHESTRMRVRCALALMLLATPLSALPAQEVYKCVDTAGRISWQDTRCPARARQQTERVPPATPGTPPVIAPDSAAAAPAPPASAPLPPPPPPQLYACVRATDGKTYVSRDGRTRPYLAPLGMLGFIQQPLADVYGGRAGARAGNSAPELVPRPSSTLIGSNYTWVRDSCRPMSVDETCAALRDAYDANEDKLRNAFQSEQPPLLQREADLQKQLAGCQGSP